MATAVLSIDIEARIANLESNFQKASALARQFGVDMAGGANQATASGEKLVSSLKDQFATLNLSEAAYQRYRAAQAGVAESAEALIVGIDGVKKATSDASKLAALLAHQEKLASDELVNAANKRNRFIESVTNEAGAIGKLRSELLTLQAAELGVSAQMAPMIDKLRTLETVGGGQFGGMANNARKAGLQMQQVGYQLNDFFVQVSSGQSPMIAFIQQGSQLSGTFGGIGPAIKGVLGLLTPMRIAIGGAAAAFGAFAYMVERSEKMDRAIRGIETGFAATGHAALLTEAQVKQYITTLERLPGSSRDAAEKSLTTLSRVPNLTGPLFERATASLQAFALLTGKELPEASQEFAAALSKPAQGLKKLDDEYNLLSVSQRLSIDRFEQQGKSAEALKLFFEAIEARAKSLNKEALTPMQQATHDLRLAWLDLTESFSKTGAIETAQGAVTGLLRGIKSYIEYFESHKGAFLLGAAGGPAGLLVGAAMTGPDEKPKRQGLVSGKVSGREDQDAADARKKAADDQEKQTIRDTEQYKSKRHEVELLRAQESSLNAILKAGNQTLEGRKDIQERIVGINEKIKSLTGGGKGQSDDPTKALLANQLKDLEHQAGEEREILSERNRTLDLLYGEHLISIKDYYENRKTAADVALNAQIADYDKEIAALEAYKAKAGKETEQAEAQGKINDLLDKKRKLTAAAAYEGKVAAFNEAKAYRDLETQIDGVAGALQRLTGNKGEGAGVAFDKQYAKYKEQLTTEKNAAELETLANLRKETVAQGEMNDEIADAALIYEKLRNTEESISISRQLGATSELGALAQLGVAREASLRQLESILLAQEAIAQASGSDKLKIAAERARLEFDKLAASADVLGDHMRTMFKDDLSGPLTTLFDDLNAGKNVLESLKGAFKSFATSVVHDIDSIAAKHLAESLFAKGSPGGDVAGWLGKIFGGVKTGAGGATGGTSFAGGADSSAAEDFFSKIAGTAKGPLESLGFKKGDSPANPLYVTNVSGPFGLAGGALAAGATSGVDAAGGVVGTVAGIAQQSPVNSTGFLSTILGSLGGLKKGDSPTNPLYVANIADLVGGAGGTAAAVSTGGSGGGGWLGTAGSLISQYFGSSSGAATSGAAAEGAGLAGVAEDFFSAFAGAASGGDTTPGWFMAGEQGPELIRTKSGARVYNNRDTGNMLGASTHKAGDTIHNYNISVTPPEGSDRRTALQWGEAVGQRIRSSGRNS